MIDVTIKPQRNVDCCGEELNGDRLNGSVPMCPGCSGHATLGEHLQGSNNKPKQQLFKLFTLKSDNCYLSDNYQSLMLPSAGK